jgi:hypothetical protein
MNIEGIWHKIAFIQNSLDLCQGIKKYFWFLCQYLCLLSICWKALKINLSCVQLFNICVLDMQTTKNNFVQNTRPKSFELK